MARVKESIGSSCETNLRVSGALIKELGSQHLGVGFPGRPRGLMKFVSKFERFMRTNESIQKQPASTDLHGCNLFPQNMLRVGPEKSIPASGGIANFNSLQETIKNPCCEETPQSPPQLPTN